MVKKEGSRVVFAEDEGGAASRKQSSAATAHLPVDSQAAGTGHGEPTPMPTTAEERRAYRRTVAQMQRTAATMCQHLQTLLQMPRTLAHEDRLPPTRVGPQSIPLLTSSSAAVAAGAGSARSPKPVRPRPLRLHLTSTNITNVSGATTSPENTITAPAGSVTSAHVPAARGATTTTATSAAGHARHRHAPPKVPALRFTTEALQRPSSDDDDDDDDPATGAVDFESAGDDMDTGSRRHQGKQRSKFRREDGAKAPATPGRCSTVTPRWTRTTRLLSSPPSGGEVAATTVPIAEPPPMLMAASAASIEAAGTADPSPPASTPSERPRHRRSHPRPQPATSGRLRCDYPIVDGKGRRLLWPVLPPAPGRGVSQRQQFREDEVAADCADFRCLPPGVS